MKMPSSKMTFQDKLGKKKSVEPCFSFKFPLWVGSWGAAWVAPSLCLSYSLVYAAESSCPWCKTQGKRWQHCRQPKQKGKGVRQQRSHSWKGGKDLGEGASTGRVCG